MFLTSQCKRYQQGEITGSVCKPLCDSKEISYSHCLRIGKDKVMVVLATWGQRKIVLKAASLSEEVNTTLGQAFDMNIDTFNKKVANMRDILQSCMYKIQGLMDTGKSKFKKRGCRDGQHALS